MDEETRGSEVQSRSGDSASWESALDLKLAWDKPSQVKPEWWTQHLLGPHFCRGGRDSNRLASGPAQPHLTFSTNVSPLRRPGLGAGQVWETARA